MGASQSSPFGAIGLIGGLALLVYGIIGSVASLFTGESVPAPAPPAPRNYKYEAMAFAEWAMKRQLKAPSTAKFPGFHDEGVTAQDWGGDKFTVWSYVDSQNGFGAMIRTRYEMTVQRQGDGNWQVESVRTEP